MSKPTPIDLSWGAPPINRQVPDRTTLTFDEVLNFQRTREAIYSLHIKGLLTETELARVLKRLTATIETAISKAKPATEAPSKAIPP